MTLVATYKYRENDSIFMLGDGLLSSGGKPQGNFIMPGIGKVGRPKSKFDYYLHSIEQKLNILGPDLAFVWADDHSMAKRFGTELYQLYISGGFDFKVLTEFTSSWTNSLTDDQRERTNLCLVYRHENNYQTWKFRGRNLEGISHFSNLWVSGSGEEIFKNTLLDEKDVIDNDNKAIAHSMNILNKFYHDDLFVMENYNTAFGGFYELASCSKTGIHKASDILIATIKIEASNVEKGLGIPMTFLKYDLYDNLAVLREIKGSGSVGNMNFNNTGHVYLPIIPELKKKAMLASDRIISENQFFDSKYIGDLKAKHTIIMLWLEDDMYTLKIPLYWRKKNRDTPLAISLVDGNVELFLSQELLDTIARNIETNIDQEKGKLKNIPPIE